jgi:FkbM family methyltransferase
MALPTKFANFFLFFILRFKKIPKFKGKYRIFKLFLKIYHLLSHNKYLIVELKNSIKMKLSILSFEKIAIMDGDYDEKEINLIKSRLNINKNILDVGCNIGFYSIFLAKYIKEKKGVGKIFAFEPHYNNYYNLKKNINMNSLNDIIIPFNFGLSNKNIISNLILREDFNNNSMTGNCSIENFSKMDQGFKKVKCKLKKFDDIKGIPKNLGLIKVDIEGHENLFFEGAKKTIKKYKPNILFELNKKFYFEKFKNNRLNFNKLFYILFECKYKMYCLSSNSRVKDLNKCKSLTNIFCY